MKYTVVVKDSQGNELVMGEIDYADFNMELTSDLVDSIDFIGRAAPARLVSKGTYINISGYIKNPNFAQDYAEATEQNAKDVGRQ